MPTLADRPKASEAPTLRAAATDRVATSERSCPELYTVTTSVATGETGTAGRTAVAARSIGSLGPSAIAGRPIPSARIPARTILVGARTVSRVRSDTIDRAPRRYGTRSGRIVWIPSGNREHRRFDPRPPHRGAERPVAHRPVAHRQRPGSGEGAASGTGRRDQTGRRHAVPVPLRPHAHRGRRARPGGATSKPASETEDAVAVAGRIMLMRDSGKLVFATIRDRSGDIQLFVSKAVVGDEAFAAIKRLDLGDWVGVHGTVMTTRKGELSVKPETDRAAGEGGPAAPRQVARPQRRRHAVPSALCRPDREPGGAAGVRDPPRDHRQLPAHAARPRVHRGRDAGAARGGRRRPCPPVHDAPQHAGSAAVPAHRVGAAPEAPDRRRDGAGVRDRTDLPQRGHLDAPQPRVHDDGALPGVRRLERRDGHQRGADHPGGPRCDRDHGRRDPGPGVRPRRAVAAGAHGRCGVGEDRPAGASEPAGRRAAGTRRSSTGCAGRPAGVAASSSRSSSRRCARPTSSGRRSSPGTRPRSRRWRVSTGTTRGSPNASRSSSMRGSWATGTRS
jgi:hypothetical protein